MRHPYPFSGSEIGAVRTCLGRAVYPRVRRTTAGAAMGSARHAFYQRVLELGGGDEARERALAEIEDAGVRSVLAALDIGGLPLDPAAYVAELAIAWDWESGLARELHRGGGRDYSMIGPTEIPATLDTVALVGEDAVFVGDYKPEYGWQPAARDHAQLRFGALALARRYGRERAIVEVIRPREGGAAWRDRGELDMFDLAEIAEEVRDLALRVVAARAAYDKDGEEPDLHITDACKRCESVHACSAQGRALAELAAPVAPDADPGVRFQQALTLENAGRAWHMLQAAEARVEEYKGILRAFAHTHGAIDLGDGRFYGPQKRNHNVIDGRKLWRVLAEMHGEEVAWAAAEVKITMSQLEDALRPIAAARGARKLAEVRREVQRAGELADGAWRVVTDDEVRVFSPPKQKAGAR